MEVSQRYRTHLYSSPKSQTNKQNNHSLAKQ